jgi:DNA repair protein RecN (Recombination protein N)
VAQASSHFFVAKNIVEDRMSTTVTSLPQAQRVQEVARLLSGDQITEAAMETAKHLMEI